MAQKRTSKSWTEYLDQPGRELTLDELVALEQVHVCANTTAARELQARILIATEQVNGRLDRLELWLARNTDYPTTQVAMPDLAALREKGITE